MSKFTEDDDELIRELDLEIKKNKTTKFSDEIQRVITKFQEIQTFYDDNKRLPSFDNQKNIFERIYAVRLEKILKNESFKKILETYDRNNLLKNINFKKTSIHNLSDDQILKELDLDKYNDHELNDFNYVTRNKSPQKPEEIASTQKCNDFEIFSPLFEKVKSEIRNGKRSTVSFDKDSAIKKNDLLILNGLISLVADVGSSFKGVDGRNENRLRLIFSNGTESNQLLRSLQKRMWEDKTSRRISSLNAGPLFDRIVDEQDIKGGVVYICRSKSENEFIKSNQEVIHKIGMTRTSIEQRLINVKEDPTFLFADIEIVKTYELYNIIPKKFESLIHKFFKNAKLDIIIKDRFGKNYKPQEWFIVSINVLNDVMEKIINGTILNYRYNHTLGILEKI